GTLALTWRDGSTRRDEVVPVEQRSSWQRAGTSCRISITLRYLDGPLGRAAQVDVCDAHTVSATPASFADIPITLDTISIDASSLPLAWPVPWSDTTTPTCRNLAPLDNPSLGLAVTLELSMPLADWRRLHSGTPLIVTVDASITLAP